MTELQTLIRLQAWLSPAFPTGAFSFSHGLEAAVAAGWVTDKATLKEWLADLCVHGPGWNDAVLLAQAWRSAGDKKACSGVCEHALAMSISSERHIETAQQGTAFLTAANAWADIPEMPDECPLPVAVGVTAGTMKICLNATLSAYLHAYLSNQIQAALRLMKLGQQGGVVLLANLEEIILQTAQRAASSTMDDLGSNTFAADISAMQHETLTSRIFRS
ncbi:MAG: urease accessory protein UreF [Pseudomonadota bacterium]